MMGIYVRLLFDVCVVGTLFAWGCRALMFGNFFRFIKRVPPIRGFGTDNEHIITINKLNDALASGGNTSQPAKISIQQEPVNSNSFLFDPLVQGRIFDAPFDAELGHEISNMLTERSSSPIDIEFSSGDETILVDDVSDEMLERIRTEAREAIDTLREEFILQTSTKDTENTHEQFFEESIKEKNENLGGMSAHEPFAENVAQDDLAALRFTNVVQSALTERMQQTIAVTPRSTERDGDQMNVRNFVGDTLFTIAETLGVDVSDNLEQSAAVQNNLQRLLNSDAAALNAQLAALEAESTQLYGKLSGASSALLSKQDQEATISATGTDVNLIENADNPPGEAATLQREIAEQQEELARAAQKIVDSQRRLSDVLNNMR